MIVADDVVRIFKLPTHSVVALRGLNLSLAEGGIHLVLGPSGSGKTTLARIMLGFDAPTAGEISIAGHDLRELTTESALSKFRRTHLGYVDQYPGRMLFTDLTVEQNIRLMRAFIELESDSGTPTTREARIDVADMLGIKAFQKTKVAHISYGESTRAALLLMALKCPRVLILDEPTAQLDADNVKQVCKMISDLSSRSLSVVTFTHDLRMLPIADTITHIRDGRVTFHQLAQTDDADITESAKTSSQLRTDSTSQALLAQEFGLNMPKDAERTFVAPVDPQGGVVLPKHVLDAFDFEPGAIFQFSSQLDKFYIANERKEAIESQPMIASAVEGVKETKTASVSEMSAPGPPVVLIDKLQKRFTDPPTQIFESLSLSIGANETVVVSGPSGSGKTTLFNVIAGLETFDSGRVEVLGRSFRPKQHPEQCTSVELRHKLALISQEANFIPSMTMEKNLLLATGARLNELRKMMESALISLEITGLLRHTPDELSAGQKKRFAILSGVLRNPRVLLLDEPTANLDYELAKKTIKFLLQWRLQSEQPTATIVATHDLDMMPTTARRLNLIDLR